MRRANPRQHRSLTWLRVHRDEARASFARAPITALLLVQACGSPANAPAVAAPVPVVASTSAQPLALAPPRAETAKAPSPNVSPVLPADVHPGEFTRVKLPNYRAALVVHGVASTRRAMIYLHGICGNVDRIRDWTTAAAEHVTTIALYGNKPCPTSTTRFSWNQDIQFIHELAQLALFEVSKARDGLLDLDRVIVFGYSQGASRAERLVERYPEHYPWVILGGPPAPPSFENLRHAVKSVILVGSEEHQDHLRDIAANLTSLGADTRFDVFEGVGHGGFGRHSPTVMVNALSWLLDDAVPHEGGAHQSLPRRD